MPDQCVAGLIDLYSIFLAADASSLSAEIQDDAGKCVQQWVEH